jgi:hypothetical protein
MRRWWTACGSVAGAAALSLLLGALGREEVARPPALVDDGACAPPPRPIEDAIVVERTDAAAEGREARSLRAFARTLEARGAKIADPCRAGVDDEPLCACASTALEPFYRSLDQSRARGGRTDVVVLGNSLIASDGIVNVVRRRLVERFGDGGPGLVLADRLAAYGPRDRTAAAAEGWRAETFAIPSESTLAGTTTAPRFGLTGVSHVSDGPAWSRWTLPPRRGVPRVVELWALDDPGAAALSWRAGNGPWALAPRSSSGGWVRAPLHVDEQVELASRAPQLLELHAQGKGAVVQGLVVETGGGVIVDTLGVPSADATLWLRTDEDLFEEQLAARDPALVVTMLGGNETRRLAWARSSRESIAADLKALLARVQRAAPGAACLVVGPIDAVEGPDAEDPFAERPQLKDVISLERASAFEQGCAFFDLHAAMGGSGSLERFHDAGVLHDDLNHPKGQGLDVLGQLIADALLDGYASSPPPALRVAAGTL